MLPFRSAMVSHGEQMLSSQPHKLLRFGEKIVNYVDTVVVEILGFTCVCLEM